MTDKIGPMSASDAERMSSQLQSTGTPSVPNVPALYNLAARIRVEVLDDGIGIAIVSELGTVGIQLTTDEAIKFLEELRVRIGLPK